MGFRERERQRERQTETETERFLTTENYIYEGQSITTDNGSISLEILLESKLSITQNMGMGVAY